METVLGLLTAWSLPHEIFTKVDNSVTLCLSCLVTAEN